MKSITVQELKRKWDKKENINLLDVREAKELSTASIHGAIHIPMMEIPNRMHELDKKINCSYASQVHSVCSGLHVFRSIWI